MSSLLAPGTARRVVITTTVRSAQAGQVGGYLRVLDLERGRVSFVAPMPDSLYQHVDPNPRGGLRGGRGVAAHGDRLVIGNAERMFVFDPDWKLTDDITHPLMANIHELHADDRGLWVTATGCDALLLIGWDGTLQDFWSFRDNDQLVEELGFPRSSPPLDPSQDYRDPRRRGRTHTIHINAVTRASEGLLVSFGRMHGFFEPDGGESVIVRLMDDAPRLAAASASIVDRRPAPGMPNHNVAEESDLVILNDSNRGVLVAHDWRRGEEQRAVMIPGNPSFARGLARLGPSLWLVGSQAPLAIYAVDLEQRKIVDTYLLGGVENETVYGICPLPDSFGDPPDVAMTDNDPYAFWRQASPGTGFTRIPA